MLDLSLSVLPFTEKNRNRLEQITTTSKTMPKSLKTPNLLAVYAASETVSGTIESLFICIALSMHFDLKCSCSLGVVGERA